MSAQETILVVDDAPANIRLLLDTLDGLGFRILVARDGRSAVAQARNARPDLVLLDVMMPGVDGFETCGQLRSGAQTADIPVIFMTALSEIADKVRGFEAGGVDYITKPFQQEEVLARVTAHLTRRRLERELKELNQQLEQRVAERTAELTEANAALERALEDVERLKDQLQRENRYLQEEIRAQHDFTEMVGERSGLKEVMGNLHRVAATDTTVIILGETGTGKELIARAVHDRSPRAARPLVKVNCAALPGELIESELFGHEKGSFTGATAQRKGRFELAHGGTIFLDEVGELTAQAQAKLLRVLQEQTFERVGGTKSLHTDIRVIAATNRDLSAMVADGKFRADLFYRLNVFPIQVPPLRERRADIAHLATFFLNHLARKLGKPFDAISPDAMARLECYPWPGNVRELQNVIERAAILARGPQLEIDDTMLEQQPHLMSAASTGDTLDDVSRAHIRGILEQCGGKIEGRSGAAAVLGVKPSTLRYRLKKLGIEKAKGGSV
jgi:formate hydrogenlyase transcriptional activator